ncbi:MAG: hypothetical protein V9H69_06770 [Anaerolineae bacterium]
MAHPDAGAQRDAHHNADAHRHPCANSHPRADAHLDARADQHPRAGDRAAGGGRAAPAPAVEVAAKAAAAPAPSVEWRLVSARRLSACENRGKHNIFVKLLDVAGNPVDGVLVVQSNNGNPGNILDRMTSGFKGPGLAEFVMWKFAEYSVFVANPDGSPASTDFAQPLHSNFVDEENCSDGGGGNTLFHNSFEVIFQRTF